MNEQGRGWMDECKERMQGKVDRWMNRWIEAGDDLEGQRMTGLEEKVKGMNGAMERWV